MSEKPRTTSDGKPRRWLRRLVFTIAALGLVGVLVAAWWPKPIAVDAAVVERGEMRVTVDEDGRTRVKDRYVVSAPLTGKVRRIDLRAGDAVKTGDVLAQLLPAEPALLDASSQRGAEAHLAAANAAQRQARTAIQRAKVALEHAKRTLEREKSLAKEGAVAQQAVELAEFEVQLREEELASTEFGARVADYEAEVARATVERMGQASKPSAEGALEHFDVTSPIDGSILDVRQVSEGIVVAGAPLLELGAKDNLEVVVDVLTTDAVRIKPGAKAFVDRWGGESALEGHVRLVEPSAFTKMSALGVEEQRVNVVIDLDSSKEQWASLGDGYRVEARVVVWHGDDVLFAPASAAFRRGEGWAVFAVRDGIATVVPIELGQRNSSQVEILPTEQADALRAGEQVIAHPSETIAEGMEVLVR